MNKSKAGAQQPQWRMPIYGDIAIITIVTVICLLPFLKKPLHVDDPLFVWIAQHITSNPTDFYGLTVNWAYVELPMDRYTQNPPLACYWLALVGTVGGWSELSLHLGMLPITLAATLGTYAVARLLCEHALWAALLSLLTPAFLVSATTLMCDVMMLALWCWAIYFWLLAYRREQVALLFVAAALVALAGLAKYYAVVLVPLLLAYSAFARPRRLLVWSVVSLLVPLAAWSAFEWLTVRLYGHGLLSSAFHFAEMGADNSSRSNESFVFRVLNLLIYPGGCVLSLVFFTPLFGSRKWLLWLGAFLLCFNLAAWALLRPDPMPQPVFVYYLHVVVFSAAGAILMALAAIDLYKRRDADSLLLLLWIVGTAVFAVFMNWTTNVRSVLPLVPAAGIIAVRRLEALDWLRPGPRTQWLMLPLGAAAAVSLLVAWADYAAAAAEKSAAVQLADMSQRRDHRVWYCAHWGFQYYMQRAGLYPLDMTAATFEVGDLYATPPNLSTFQLPPTLMEPLTTLQYPAAPLGSTMSSASGAGFYSTWTGPLPFSLAPTQDFEYLVAIFPKKIVLREGVPTEVE